jgi:hypothetical protein
MIEQWTDPVTGTLVFRVSITEREGAKLSAEAWEMLQDGAMLISSALAGDTTPKFLPSVGAMSHAAASHIVTGEQR